MLKILLNASDKKIFDFNEDLEFIVTEGEPAANLDEKKKYEHKEIGDRDNSEDEEMSIDSLTSEEYDDQAFGQYPELTD